LNILGPFIALASPTEIAYTETKVISLVIADPSGHASVTTSKSRNVGKMSHAFKSVLDLFQREEVGVMIRLNDEL